MDTAFIYIVLMTLATSLLVNFLLTLRLMTILRRAGISSKLSALVPGQLMPQVEAESLANQTVKLGQQQQATVLLFLSSNCPKCKGKLAELAKAMAMAEKMALEMWFISYEPRQRLTKFLQDSSLTAATLKVNKKVYRLLNPAFITPSYLFINHQGNLEATGFIGDENWQAFYQQLEQETTEQEAIYE